MNDLSKHDAAPSLAAWRDPDTDRVDVLCRQNRELTEEVIRQDDALVYASDRIDELVDELRHPRQRVEWLRAELDWWRGYAGIATVAALTLGAILCVRLIGGL